MCAMFAGLSTSISHKNMIVPITTRQAILQNSTSSYKIRRRCRALQIRSLHDEIVHNERQWEEFHYILQQQMVHNNGMTNSALKALVCEALEVFTNKNVQEESNGSSDPIDIVSLSLVTDLCVSISSSEMSAPGNDTISHIPGNTQNDKVQNATQPIITITANENNPMNKKIMLESFSFVDSLLKEERLKEQVATNRRPLTKMAMAA